MSSQLSPAVLSVIENNFVDKLSGAFSMVSGYAMDIFYLVAAIEIAFFGISWALRQDEGFSRLIIKIIKLGFIFFVISSYPHILQVLVDGFTQIAFDISAHKTGLYVFEPAHLWKFGFDSSIGMLKLATQYGTANIGMSILYLVLGFGNLLLFALIGAEIILIIVAFYVVALVALLMIPLGSFQFANNLFTRAIQGVMKVGAMIFALVLVLGVAVPIWGQFDLKTITVTTNLLQPMGLFFSTLVFWVLAIKLPKLAASAVGELGGSIFPDSQPVNVSVNVPAPAAAVINPVSAVADGTNLTSATVGQSGAVSSVSMAANISAGSGGQSLAGAVNVTQTGSNTASASSISKGAKAGRVSRGAQVTPRISSETMRRLKDAFKE